MLKFIVALLITLFLFALPAWSAENENTVSVTLGTGMGQADSMPAYVFQQVGYMHPFASIEGASLQVQGTVRQWQDVDWVFWGGMDASLSYFAEHWSVAIQPWVAYEDVLGGMYGVSVPVQLFGNPWRGFWWSTTLLSRWDNMDDASMGTGLDLGYDWGSEKWSTGPRASLWYEFSPVESMSQNGRRSKINLQSQSREWRGAWWFAWYPTTNWTFDITIGYVQSDLMDASGAFGDLSAQWSW